MEKFNLHKNIVKDSTNLHKDDLGMDIPNDYFKTSKLKIMEKVSIATEEKQKVLYLRPNFRFLIAASIALLIGFGIVLKYNEDNNNQINVSDVENLANATDEDILINSLFVNDDEMNDFLDTYLVNGVVVRAEIEEQEFENIFINSIIEKDSLIDSYIDNNFIECIIL